MAMLDVITSTIAAPMQIVNGMDNHRDMNVYANLIIMEMVLIVVKRMFHVRKKIFVMNMQFVCGIMYNGDLCVSAMKDMKEMDVFVM